MIEIKEKENWKIGNSCIKKMYTVCTMVHNKEDVLRQIKL